MITLQNSKKIKKNGAFLYTNEKGIQKAFVYRDSIPHPTTEGLRIVHCHYADDPNKIVHRSMYTNRIVYTTRLAVAYKSFKARLFKKS